MWYLRNLLILDFAIQLLPIRRGPSPVFCGDVDAGFIAAPSADAGDAPANTGKFKLIGKSCPSYESKKRFSYVCTIFLSLAVVKVLPLFKQYKR